MPHNNPFLAGLELVKQNSGTSGQAALAKCILSLYNAQHAFSIGEILGPLDTAYTNCVLAMIKAYADHGETAELRKAGEWVVKDFPRLCELSSAMSDARYRVKREWDAAHEAEMRRLYPDD